VEMICANPDIVVRWNGKLAWCAGAIARVYEGLGGKVVYAGKPYAPIYAIATKEIEKAANRPVPASRVLAIGDGPATDMRGANLNSMDALFIAHDEGVHDGNANPDALARALAEADASAVAAMRSLRW
jgi:ribonucleotide monophosphatase NagD (HAD superfamily)